VTKELFSGSLGEGAYLNGDRINCVEKFKLSEMVILNSRSETRRGLWDPYKNIFSELKAVGSVAYKLGLTAAGKSDIFASLRPKNEWDICAGNCIINEAKGKLIDLNGHIRVYNQPNTLITPGLIAGEVLSVDRTLKVLKV
jgi:myo-inositol-1(or 4)-monophosphatase